MFRILSLRLIHVIHALTSSIASIRILTLSLLESWHISDVYTFTPTYITYVPTYMFFCALLKLDSVLCAGEVNKKMTATLAITNMTIYHT